MSAARVGGRMRAYLEFLVAVAWFFAARALAARGAAGLVREEWTPLIEQAMLVFLLLAGYGFLLRTFDREPRALAGQGLPCREGWWGELGLGLAAGWGLALVCVLPMTAIGGIAIALNLHAAAWGWLVVELGYFALTTLAGELFLRGYGFQRFERALGPFAAMIGFALLYAILESIRLGANHASFAVALALGILLSTAYLRTRALWVSWGIHFGWRASRAVLFGLAIAGDNAHSPVVRGTPMGPFWLTGGGYGLDGSWLAFAVVVAALPVVVRLTRDLDFRWNAPVLVPGGIPVDLDAESRRQHEAAMGPAEAPAAPVLVQIQPSMALAPVQGAQAAREPGPAESGAVEG